MRYRRLTLEEFQTLKTQFIQYLSVNSITGLDWEKIIKNNPKKMNDMLDEFSDVVMASVVERAKYLVQTGKNNVMIFDCNTEHIDIVGISTEVEANFNQYEFLGEAIKALPDDARIQTFFHTKTYMKSRDTEIFELLESGCQITDEATFQQVCGLAQV